MGPVGGGRLWPVAAALPGVQNLPQRHVLLDGSRGVSSTHSAASCRNRKTWSTGGLHLLLTPLLDHCATKFSLKPAGPARSWCVTRGLQTAAYFGCPA